MSTADSVANVVNTWFSERLASGPLARDTPAYNQVVSALPDLISRLAPLLFRIRGGKCPAIRGLCPVRPGLTHSRSRPGNAPIRRLGNGNRPVETALSL
jgi:hypothetical protein